MLDRRHDAQHHPDTQHKPRADRDWRARAACRGTDPEVFFPAAESGPVRDRQVAEAKAVCAGCLVLDTCRAWAIEALPVGIAGGLTEHERRRLPAAAGRARSGTALVAPPVGGSPREFAAAGRAAVAAGESVASVARRFGVHERTVYHWRAATTATSTSAASVAGPVGGVG